MSLIGLTAPQTRRYARARPLLEELAIYDDLRAAVLIGLTDDTEPNSFRTLRDVGKPMSYSAGTHQLFGYAGPLIGATNRIDRERRDYVFPQLREVGIIRLSTVLPVKHARTTGELIKPDVHDPPKTPNSAYMLTDEARALFDAADADFPRLLASFVLRTPARRLRAQQRAAARAVENQPASNKHSALMRAAAALLVAPAQGYEIVCIDDSDGTRLAPHFEARLDQLNLRPTLGSRWPDVILANESTHQVWYVDAVTSDGEIDEVRKSELEAWSAARGWRVGGYTTAYERWSDAARRQGRMSNLAVGSTLWIAEDGGKLFEVRALPAASSRA